MKVLPPESRPEPCSLLPGVVRQHVEGAFGADFSRIRMLTGPVAADLNTRLEARAFTVGQDIVFGSGQPSLTSASGQELLAHELTHTLQQTSGAARRVVRRTVLDDARVRSEAEHKYAQHADLLERKLGSHLSPMPEVNAIADDMLARLRKIVDAWAEATKTGTFPVYVRADDERGQLIVYGVLPDNVGEANRLSVAALLSGLNYGTSIGNFEIDLGDGEVRFRPGSMSTPVSSRPGWCVIWPPRAS